MRYCICDGVRFVASEGYMCLGNCSYKFGYMWVLPLSSLLQLGTSRFSKVSGCMSPCTEQQEAHLSDILWGIPAVKTEKQQKLCVIYKNFQRRVLLFLALGKEFVVLIEDGIGIIGEGVLDVSGISFALWRKNWWSWASFGAKTVHGSFVSLLWYWFWSRLILVKLFCYFSDCHCWCVNTSLLRCRMILRLVNKQFWKIPVWSERVVGALRNFDPGFATNFVFRKHPFQVSIAWQVPRSSTLFWIKSF